MGPYVLVITAPKAVLASMTNLPAKISSAVISPNAWYTMATGGVFATMVFQGTAKLVCG